MSEITNLRAKTEAPEIVTYERRDTSKNLEGSATPLIADIIALNDPKRQSLKIQELFPGKIGLNMRLLTYSYLFSTWAADHPEVDPQSFPLNFVGRPGFGKSATVYTWGRKLGLEVINRSLQGISDFESVLGITHIDPQTGRAKLFVPDDLPLAHEKRHGVFFFDDYNRGEAHCIAGAMQFSNTRVYNQYKAPKTFAVVAASNPSGHGHRVKSEDEAQYTRFLPIVVKGEPEVLLEQLIEQGAPGMLYAYHSKFKDQLQDICNKDPYILPEPRLLNFRNIMGHALLTHWLQHDPAAMNAVSYAIYGSTFMSQLESLESGDFPIEVSELLHDAPEKTSERVKTLIKRRKQDVLTATVGLLVSYLNRPETSLTKAEVNRVCEFFMALPEGVAMVGLRRLVMNTAPRQQYYAQLLLLWNSPDGQTAGPLSDHFVKMTQGALQEVKAARMELAA